MNIIIVGSGKVGSHIAEQLVREKHDVTIIDHNEEILHRLSETLDIMTIKGNGISTAVLSEANVENADLIIAATSEDEVNMVCCLTAKKMGAKYAIARIRTPEYTDSIVEIKENLKIDMIINPEQATAVEISRLLRFPSATDIDTFCRGRIELMGFRLQEGDFICGKSLMDLPSSVKKLQLLFCVADRHGDVCIPKGSFVPMPGDKMYIIGHPSSFDKFFKLLGRYTPKVKKVFVIGGGKVGNYLFDQMTKMKINLKVIERKMAQCLYISEHFPDAMVINGDGSDQELLDSENLDSYDAFVALTDRDEDNLIISLYASQHGVPKIVTKCNKQNYVGLAHSIGLDSVVSPKMITASHILHRVRGMQNSQGNVMNSLHQIADGEAEAIEFTATKSTKHLGKALKDIKIKPNILVAIVMRGKELIIPDGKTFIQQGDSVIIINRGDAILDLNDIFVEEVSYVMIPEELAHEL